MVQWRAFKIHGTWPLHCRFFIVKNVPQIIKMLFTLRKIILLGTCHWNDVWEVKNSGPMAWLRPPPPVETFNIVHYFSSLLKSCDRSQISLTLMMSKKMTLFARPHRVWHYWWCSLILCFTEEVVFGFGTACGCIQMTNVSFFFFSFKGNESSFDSIV